MSGMLAKTSKDILKHTKTDRRPQGMMRGIGETRKTARKRSRPELVMGYLEEEGFLFAINQSKFI